MVTEWVQEGVARARKLDDCNTFDANEALLLRQVADGATAPTAGRTPSRSLGVALFAGFVEYALVVLATAPPATKISLAQ